LANIVIQFSSAITVRNGVIAKIKLSFRDRAPKKIEKQIETFLWNVKLHKIDDWESAFLGGKVESDYPQYKNIVKSPAVGFNQLLGCGSYNPDSYVAQWGFSKEEIYETQRWQKREAEAEKARKAQPRRQ
jgi:hypothetical protein